MRRIFTMMIALALPTSFALAEPVEVPVSKDQITLTFAPVVKRVVPAVVNIYTRHVEKVQMQASPFMNDPLFRQFFGNGGFGGLPRERVVNSLGSGVIVGSDGTIVTSFHVVKGSDQITVVLSDKREFEGHVERADESSDLAILKVDTKGAKLPILELRDSDTLEVGDLVLAVGNPFGVGQTVTSGIISALARSEADISDYQFFIQTDAAINPGNSGGALVDMQGRLIGINTAIYTHSGGYQGIGFAIPANMVRAVLKEQVNKSGNVIRPWFGVITQEVTREVADAKGLDVRKGVLVQEVAAGSPAEKAGIKAGDIITSIGGNPVDSPQSFNFRMVTTGIGVETHVGVWRSGAEVLLPATFISAPEAPEIKTFTIKGNNPLNGVTVARLTPEIAEQLHLKSTQERVVVVRSNDGNDFGIGFQVGDVIIAINGKPIHTVEDLKKVLSADTQRFQVNLVRDGAVMTMTVQH